MRFALYEGEIVDIDGCLSQLSVIKYTEEMCLKYVRGLKEIENFLRKSYGSLIYSCHTRKKRNLVIKVSFLEAPTRFELVIEVLQTRKKSLEPAKTLRFSKLSTLYPP